MKEETKKPLISKDTDLLRGARLMSRWNICQRIGSQIYHSPLSDIEIELYAQNLQETLKNI